MADIGAWLEERLTTEEREGLSKRYRAIVDAETLLGLYLQIIKRRRWPTEACMMKCNCGALVCCEAYVEGDRFLCTGCWAEYRKREGLI